MIRILISFRSTKIRYFVWMLSACHWQFTLDYNLKQILFEWKDRAENLWSNKSEHYFWVIERARQSFGNNKSEKNFSIAFFFFFNDLEKVFQHNLMFQKPIKINIQNMFFTQLIYIFFKGVLLTLNTFQYGKFLT